MTTWLHLSDLHMSTHRGGIFQKEAVESLLNNLNKRKDEDNLSPEFLFFTGDGAFGHEGEGAKSLEAQYKDFTDFLKRVRDIFSIKAENTFIVPGNHDINRKMTNKILQKYMSSPLCNESEITEMLNSNDENFSNNIRVLSDYRIFLENSDYKHLLDEGDTDRLIYQINRQSGDKIICISGFNSAWNCGPNDEEKKSWLGAKYQLTALSQITDPIPDVTFALLHHPISWFRENQNDLNRQFQSRFNILLQGHLHDLWADQINDHLRIDSGAVYGHGHAEDIGYNIGQIDWNEGILRLFFTHYTEKQGWVPYQSTKLKTDGKGCVEYSNFSWLKNTVPSLPIPSQAETAKTLFGRNEIIRRIVSAFEKKNIITLYGLQGIGKTSVALEVAKCLATQGFRRKHYTLTPHIKGRKLFKALLEKIGKDESYIDILLGKSDNPFAGLALKKTQQETDSKILFHIEKCELLNPNGKFRDDEEARFFALLIEKTPNLKIIMEHRELPPKFPFSSKIHESFKLSGLRTDAVKEFFAQTAFNEGKGWQLNEDEADYVTKRLGGEKEDQGAHPYAMVLLASIADEESLEPVITLQDKFGDVENELEDKLFAELYDTILTEPERKLLRLCTFYEEIVPREQIPMLIEFAGDGALIRPVRRFLLLEREGGWTLHSLIRELVRGRMEYGSKIFQEEATQVGHAWAEHAIKEEFEHLKIEYALNAIRSYEQAEWNLGLKDLQPEMEGEHLYHRLHESSNQLHKQNSIEKNYYLNRLGPVIAPKEAIAYAMAGEATDRLFGRGSDEALSYFWKAYRLEMAHPQNLLRLGRCLIARDETEDYLEIVTKLEKDEPDIYTKVMNNYNLAEYLKALERIGKEDQASLLRQRLIRQESNFAGFYNDEAKYLVAKSNKKPNAIQEALQIIQIPIDRNFADVHTYAIKASLLEADGRGPEASALRLEFIDQKGIKDPVFFNNEARYNMNRFTETNDPAYLEEAERLLRLARERKCEDDILRQTKKNLEKLQQTNL